MPFCPPLCIFARDLLPLPFRRTMRRLAGMVIAEALLAVVSSSPAAVPAYRQADEVVVITIRGGVDQVTATSLERRLAEAADADAIVIELNTPGGGLLPTLDICHTLKTKAPPNTVAWIHPRAFSAGTIIALACRDIIVSPDATFGDAAPITALGPIPATERAKVESPILVEVIDSARRNHYDERLVESFVSVGIELWLLRNTKTGETICVNAAEYETVFGEPPPRNFSPIHNPQSAAAPIVPFFQSLRDAAAPDEGPPIDPTMLMELPSSRLALTSDDADCWELVEQIVPNDRLLTLKPGAAMAYGLADTSIANDKELADWFGATSVRRLNRTWSESLVRLLISWPVRLVLIAIFIICIVVEMATGGAGFFGTGAVICLAILLGAPWLAGLAQTWDIVLVVFGLALIATELFLIPGTGIAGVAGVLCLFLGMIGTFVTGDLDSPIGQQQLLTGLLTTIGGGGLAAIAIWIMLRFFGGAALFQRLVLDDQLLGQSVPVPHPNLSPRPTIGDIAIAATDLRPSGRIEHDGQLHDAVTSGQWIDAGSTVRVIQSGLTIEVEECPS